MPINSYIFSLMPSLFDFNTIPSINMTTDEYKKFKLIDIKFEDTPIYKEFFKISNNKKASREIWNFYLSLITQDNRNTIYI